MKYETEIAFAQCEEKKWHTKATVTFETGDIMVAVMKECFDSKDLAEIATRKAVNEQIKMIFGCDGSHLKSEPLYSRETDERLH